MANKYLYSGAAGTADGSSWTNAYTTLGAAFTGSTAGDFIWVAHDHAESNASAQTVTSPGTATAPVYIICVSRSGSVPPVAADILATATMATTSTNTWDIRGHFYMEGISITQGSGASASSLNFGANVDGHQVFKNCKFILGNTNGNSFINFGPTNASRSKIELINTTVKFGAGQSIAIRCTYFNWRNTLNAIDGTGTIPTLLFKTQTANDRTSLVVCEGVDFSALGSGKTIVNPQQAYNTYIFRGCKLGASVTKVSAPTGVSGGTVDFIDCNSGAVNYDMLHQTSQGSQVPETTIVHSGGASDGTTAASWKISTTSSALLTEPFDCTPIMQWIDTTGSQKTVTMEIINDGITLTNADAWLSIQALDSSLTPMYGHYSSAPQTILTAGTTIATSTETWVTSGMTTPVKQKITVPFTPGMKGWFLATLRVARPSVTALYVDPKLTVT